MKRSSRPPSAAFPAFLSTKLEPLVQRSAGQRWHTFQASACPRVGVSAVIWRLPPGTNAPLHAEHLAHYVRAVHEQPFEMAECLMVRRGRELARGQWSLPGGSLHFRERVEDGTVREVLEETGLDARTGELILGPMLTVTERIREDEPHYVILTSVGFAAHEGRLVAGDDADRARWVSDRSEQSGMVLTDGCEWVIQQVWRAMLPSWWGAKVSRLPLRGIEPRTFT